MSELQRIQNELKEVEPPPCHCFMYGCDELGYGESVTDGCFKEWNRSGLGRRWRELKSREREFLKRSKQS